MAGSIYHVYTQTVADGAATSVVRPSDWNSNHTYSGIQDGISAGTVIISSGTAVFSNSGGVSFGISGQTVTATVATNYQSQGAYLTTAMQSNAATISNVNISAGTTSTNASAFTFSNANGVSFGLGSGASAGVVTGTVATNYQSQGAYLTTADLSQNSSNYISAWSLAGVHTAGTTTTAIGVELYLSGGNNITLSGNSNTIVISGPNVGGAQTGISGIADGAGTQTVGTVSFANSNGISFGLSTGANTGTITASYTVPATAGLISGLNVSGGAGNSQSNVSGITFSNSNGITFGVSTGAKVVTVTASYTVPTQTVQTLSAIVSSNTTGNTSGMTFDARSISFQGYGIASVGLSTTNTGSSILISASQTVQTQASGAIAGTGFTSGGANVGISGTHNTAGLSLSITVAAQTNQTLSAVVSSNTVGNTSGMTFDARSMTFQGYGAASVGLSTTNTGSSILISAPVQSVQTQNCVDVTIAGNSTSAGAGYALVSSGTLTLAGGNNITLSQNGNAVTISAGACGGGGGIASIANGANTQTTGMVSFANSNGVTFGLSTGPATGTMTASVAAQSNQSVGLYLTGNTTNNTSTTFDARTLGTWSANGAATFGFSNGSVQLSVPNTSSISVTGALSKSVNGATISLGVANGISGIADGAGTQTIGTLSFANGNGVTFGLSTGNSTGTLTASVAAQSVQTQNFCAISFGTGGGSTSGTLALISSGTALIVAGNNVTISQNGQSATVSVANNSFYAVGNTTGTSSGSGSLGAISISGNNGINVAASNSGWNIGEVPLSAYEPFSIVTGTAYSSHAPASWWFNRVVIQCPIAISNINVVKSFSAGLASASSVASSNSSKHAFSYSHGVTVYSRQDYGAHSSNLTTVTTASVGITFTYGYTSTSQVFGYSCVTDTTGGTSSYSTSSGATNLLSFFTGPKIMQIPCVTTLAPGEYFFAHAHSSTTATSNSNVTIMSISNLHIAPQVVNSQIGVLGSNSGTFASLNPWGLGAGIASAVTTNNSMAGSVISGQTQNNWYMAISNV